MKGFKASGMRKQLKNTAQVKKNAETAVDINPISRLFGRKSPNRRVGRPKMTKRQRGSVKKRGKYTSESTSKLKSLNAKTIGRSNTSPGCGVNKSEEEKKTWMKWSAEYFHRVQECWGENNSLAIYSNGGPITGLREYAVIIGMFHPTFYRYCRDEKLKCQLIGTVVGKNITLLNGDDIDFMSDVMVRSDCVNNGMISVEAMDSIQEINPTLYRKQAKYQLDRCVLTKSHAD